MAWKYWPSGRYGTSWKATVWISRAMAFWASMSGASNHFWRSSSSFGMVGQPNQAFWPWPRRDWWTPGLNMSSPAQKVKNTLQPPRSGGSLLARRCTTVPQSVET